MNKKKITAALLVWSLLLSVFCAAPQTVSADTDENTSPMLNEKHLELVEKNTFQLTVENLDKNQTVTFKSDDTSIVTLTPDDKNGAEIEAVGTGFTTVTVKVKEKRLFFSRVVKTLECDVLVGPPALSIKCKHSKIQMNVGKTKKMPLILKPSNTTEVPVYKSSFPSVVSVSKNGRMAAKKGGKAVITATITNDNSVSCIVIVTDEEETDKEKTKE